MALGLLGILAMVYLFIFIATLFILAYKKGYWIKNNKVFISIQLIALLFTYMAFTSLPTNYLFQRVICIVLGIIEVSAYLFKDINFNLSRIFLAIGLIGASLLLWI